MQTSTMPTAQEMVEKAQAKYPDERFAVSRSGSSIAVWRGTRWECVSMQVMGFGWVSATCNDRVVAQSDWIES